jgi:hypothetical protein
MVNKEFELSVAGNDPSSRFALTEKILFPGQGLSLFFRGEGPEAIRQLTPIRGVRVFVFLVWQRFA